MGASYVKDPNLDIFIESNKAYYVAGDYVEGCAYIDAKVSTNYSNITLYVLGNEYVYWTTGSGKNRRTHSNNYESYRYFIMMNDFKQNVGQGQYAFPFAFQLPSMMCGSFFASNSCFIKYVIKAELIHPTDEKKTQYFEMPLNIMEPPRMPIGRVMKDSTTHSRCCGCCKDYGTTKISMTADKNFVVNGDSISVKGVVDNSQGKEDILSGRVELEEWRIMISSGGRVRHYVERRWPLHGINQPIRKG